MKDLIKTTIPWNDTDEVPEAEQPILCYTENGKIMTFKEIRGGKASWDSHYVKKYAIVLWTYQAAVSIQLAKEIFGAIARKL